MQRFELGCRRWCLWIVLGYGGRVIKKLFGTAVLDGFLFFLSFFVSFFLLCSFPYLQFMLHFFLSSLFLPYCYLILFNFLHSNCVCFFVHFTYIIFYYFFMFFPYESILLLFNFLLAMYILFLCAFPPLLVFWLLALLIFHTIPIGFSKSHINIILMGLFQSRAAYYSPKEPVSPLNWDRLHFRSFNSWPCRTQGRHSKKHFWISR